MIHRFVETCECNEIADYIVEREQSEIILIMVRHTSQIDEYED